MFILTTISDLVQIPPFEFWKKNRDELEDKINEKYANKVVPKVGLCICLYDILKTSDGLIGHGTGNANVNVEFRMIVFRPFKGEIIHGIVKTSTPDGIQIHTDFFQDIYVPKTMLFEGCVYDGTEKVWVWKTGDTEIFFDDGTVVKLRIEKEIWNNQAQIANAIEGENASARSAVPYSIEGSMAEPGLGGVEWW